MGSENSTTMIAQWLKEKGYSEEDSQRILAKLAEHDHETLSDAVFDSIGNGGKSLDDMIQAMLAE